MTRKRFTKLLMAHGYSRNEANRIAEEISANGKTYAEGYAEFLEFTERFAVGLSDTVERVSKIIAKTAQALGEAIAAFSKAYHERMAAD